MGIKGLAQIIESVSPDATRSETNLNRFSGKTIAIDASTCLYQSLTAATFTNAAKNTDSGHLMGIYFTNIRLLQCGLKPIYVFDGKPPQQKRKRLKSREHRRETAKVRMTQAEVAGNSKSAAKYRRQTLKIEKHHVEDTKLLLKLLGIPYLQAPGEAEAQCAELERSGKVYATASEDLSTLAFGSRVLLRHLTLKSNKGNPIVEVHLDKILEGIGINFKQFIDLSILLGCNYCSNIKNIGTKLAVKLIRQYQNIEGILQNIDPEVYKVPQDWRYNEARYLFEKPLVTLHDELEFQWNTPDLNNIKQFLCEEKKLNELRVQNGLTKLSKCLLKK